MTGIEAPNRAAWTQEAYYLAKRDTNDQSLRNCEPETLPLDAIHEATAVFQVRYDSLVFAPGGSEKHIKKLASVARRGDTLDPVTVMDFGNEWYLVDGHHRLAAYRLAQWAGEVPVRALKSPLCGMDRVNWAAAVGNAENNKDRLNISDTDRQDAAWRAVVTGAFGSKSETAKACDVSTSLIGIMRAAKGVLENQGYKQPMLIRMGWRQASWEAKRASGQDDSGSFDVAEKRRRLLAKNLAPVLKLRPSAAALLEALEAARPGITIELETVIAWAKEDRTPAI